MNEKDLIKTAHERANIWLGEGFDEETHREVKLLLSSNEENRKKELIDAFYKDIDFGTGGVRGLMGVGTNRINIYTLAKVTQGLINFAEKNFPYDLLKVVIAYDTRNYSEMYSNQIAEIFATVGADVYCFNESMPTPLLSYAVRKLGCRIGIVITASHNPKEYNGYKVYFDDGGQIVPPWDSLIIEEVNKVTEVKSGIEGQSYAHNENRVGTLKQVNQEIITSYQEEIISLARSLSSQLDLSTTMVFSSLHGTGGKLILPMLKDLGFRDVHTVPSQMEPDGNFPTVKYPNPEEKEALALGLEAMKKKQADFLMATDPDADRLGVAIQNHEGSPLILNGNQIGLLLADFILASHQKKGMPIHPFLVRTIVTTPLIDKIAEFYGLDIYKVLTGFKYVGELIRKFENKKKFLFGLEESHGYLATDIVRDKDAVSSAILFAVMTSGYKKQGISVYRKLCEIYQKHGFRFEELIFLTKTGPLGKKDIEEIISAIRKNYSTGDKKSILDDENIQWFRDYASGYELDLVSKQKNKITLPSSNVIQLETDNHTLITIRPSGTEPKIKFYFSVCIPLSGEGSIFSQVDVCKQIARKKIDALKKVFIR